MLFKVGWRDRVGESEKMKFRGRKFSFQNPAIYLYFGVTEILGFEVNICQRKWEDPEI